LKQKSNQETLKIPELKSFAVSNTEFSKIFQEIDPVEGKSIRVFNR